MAKKKEEKVIEIDITNQIRAIKNLFNFKKSNVKRTEGEFLTNAETSENSIKVDDEKNIFKDLFKNRFKRKEKRDMKEEIKTCVEEVRKQPEKKDNLISELKEVYELE